MRQEIFKSERSFTLFDVVVSHGQLLLRSQKNNNEYEKNIDIIFFDTTYIQLFTSLNGVCITKINNSLNIVDYPKVNKYIEYEINNIFEIESNSDKYYIAASFVRVFENQLEFNESSLNLEDGRKI